ncbi:sulfotransferase [Thermostaphylospora chromogena]|uniref:Sulfotransferase family protein n=1 Tax=Thermostaphylospora chromogena TaxID=35622 RepID=A0A1H1BAD6_9ACTN|nr:sulfotransferase [Thermostaphylospora chromogena]SDQ48877.1 hypothetical protein SAMN04489764_0872 [Thermostaphylospora chromogena]
MTEGRPVRVIYLGGLGRSGTTLLERLLGEVPAIVPLGEVVHLWRRGLIEGEPCGCGARLVECPFWRKIGQHAFGGWSTERAHRMLALRRAVDRTRRIPPRRSAALLEYVDAYRRVYTAAAEVADSDFVVDSSKHASLAFCLYAGGIDLHVLHVVRDPRAVAHSWRRHVSRPEDGRPMTRWSPARTCLHWATQNLALELLAARGARVTRVRYEDLLAAPRRTLAGLLLRFPVAAHLGFLTDRRAQLTTAHTASGNPIRFATGPIDLVPDDEWRTALPRSQRALVTALTWPLMRRYGYRVREAGR